MKKKRVFLAFTVGPIKPTAIKLKKLQEQLRTYRIKWVSTDNFHVTLFFFGELTEEQIEFIQKHLHEALNNVQAFRFSINGPDIFRNRQEARVLWLGIEAFEPTY
ncbi:MAG: RNA 2',3'-cyclic phosphodiesterase [Paludibacter sp.]